MTVRPTIRGRMRYDWWRAHHGLPQHAKWRSVARQAGVPVSVVFHIAVCLLDLASRSDPRGSIGDFKPFDCAGIVDVPVDQVEAVLVILRDIHWIEGHMLAEWEERQPNREDQGAARRKAEERARSHAQSHNVTHSKRDTPSSHASNAGQDKVLCNVTNVAAPDRDKKDTSFLLVAAREEKSEQTDGLLATAHPTGALARRPEIVPVAKRPSDVSREELDAIFAAKRVVRTVGEGT